MKFGVLSFQLAVLVRSKLCFKLQLLAEQNYKPDNEIVIEPNLKQPKVEISKQK